SHLFIVPRCILESLITIPVVTKILSKCLALDGAEVSEVARITCESARQLFATLAYMKKVGEIYPLLNEGVSDKDLPLRRRPNDQGLFTLQRETGGSIGTLDKWNQPDLEKFDRIQRWMTAPVFKDQKHYDLDDNTILPFIPFKSDPEIQEPKQGGYSEVYPVCVHPSHHQFW